MGSNCRSAIATLVERQTRFVMLVHLPNGHGAIAVRDGLLATIKTLPERLRKTLTWDQGTELAQHKQITMATKMAIYFCDPHSPWQRGSNIRGPLHCCANIFPRAPTSPRTARNDCSKSPTSSTTARAKPSAAPPPLKPCSDYYSSQKNPVLQRPPEFADPLESTVALRFPLRAVSTA